VKYDFLIAGGGLSGGLLAYRLKQTHPEWRGLVLERGDSLGGRHTWSFHESDLAPSLWEWVKPLVSYRWSEHEVRFPAFQRKIRRAYASIRSVDFHEKLTTELKETVRLQTEVAEVGESFVRLADGQVMESSRVIDARGFLEWDNIQVGYQKFIGWEVALEEPHRLAGPILMDATIAQTDGYRFMYVLPFEANRLLIEDTHYSDRPDLGRDHYRDEIETYALRHGWKIREWLSEEVGVLPIPLQRRWSEVALGKDGQSIGVRAGLFQPTTGYSFPYAVKLVEQLASRDDWKGEWLLEHVNEAERRGKFFRFLNRMLFQGCAPHERYRILERFYRLPEETLARFYAGELRTWDYVRILVGRPPISIQRAWDCYPDLSEVVYG